jgi:hypothetical protein
LPSGSRRTPVQVGRYASILSFAKIN